MKTRTPTMIGIALAASATLAGCLGTPDSDSSSGPLKCASSERPFNGACRTVCNGPSDCTGPGETCKVASPGTSLCMQGAGCAFLGSDTTCELSAPGGGYGGYGGYGELATPSCVGNAKWQAIAGSDSSTCGQHHAVRRCGPSGGGCVIADQVTADVADQ